jgi:ribosomal protein S18 acetylase RimI-like enzyme
MTAGLREARIEDADPIAALQAASWCAAYRGIMADAYLDGPVVEERRNHWRAKLTVPQPGDLVLLAEDHLGELVGFIALGPDPETRFEMQIDNLHVHPSRKGQGLGRRLLGEAAALLARSGRRSVYLWVFDANRMALRFYLALGGSIAERGIERLDGRDVPQTRIVWRDTAQLAIACGLQL